MRMKYTLVNINDIPIEQAHGGSGARQMLVTPDRLTTKNFEAMTKGYLKAGAEFDWHKHTSIDEYFLVLKGRGKFYWEDEIINYKEGDIITIPANSRHKIVATGDVDNEFYFVRIMV